MKRNDKQKKTIKKQSTRNQHAINKQSKAIKRKQNQPKAIEKRSKSNENQ